MEANTLNEETFNYVAVDQLQGLLLPAEPPVFNTALWLATSLIFCLVGLGIWRLIKHRQTPLYLAHKKLDALAQQYNKTDQPSQNMAIQLASLLCQGLGVKRLDQYQPHDIHAWNIFKNTLNSACYSESETLDSSLQKGQKRGVCAFSNSSLIKEAKQWLNQSKLNNDRFK